MEFLSSLRAFIVRDLGRRLFAGLGFSFKGSESSWPRGGTFSSWTIASRLGKPL
jgi:hypothetical protein